MKASDKIILYLDGQLNEDERIRFEKELESSAELRNELTKFRKFAAEIGELKNIETEPDYFVNMVPHFRERLSAKKKYKLMPRLALGLSTITAIAIILIFVLNYKTTEVNNIANNISDSVTQNYSLNFSPLNDQIDLTNLTTNDDASIDSVISSMLSDELNISAQSYNEIMADNNSSDLQTMLQGINTTEADRIYNELLHKRIY